MIKFEFWLTSQKCHSHVKITELGRLEPAAWEEDINSK